MAAEDRVNCIGRVYYEFGIDEEEQFRKPGTVDKVFEPHFERVSSREEADIVVAVNREPNVMPGHEGHFAPHASIIIKDTSAVRERKGRNEPINSLLEDDAFRRYDRHSERVYMRLRQRPSNPT